MRYPPLSCSRQVGRPSDQLRAHLERVLAIGRQLLDPAARLVRRIEGGHFVLRVVAELAGVGRIEAEHVAALQPAGDRRLHRAEGLRVAALLHPGLVHVHRVEDRHRQRSLAGAGIVLVVDQVLEQQPFQEASHLAAQAAEIDGRAEKQGVGLFDALQHRGQPVLHGAMSVAVAAFQFASEATVAAFEIEIVEMNDFRLRPLGGCAFERLTKQRRGVPVLPGAPIDSDDFHDLVLGMTGQVLGFVAIRAYVSR